MSVRSTLSLLAAPAVLCFSGGCGSVRTSPSELSHGFAWHDSAGAVSDPELAALCADAWELRMREDPVGATYLGDPRYHGKLPDNSKAGADRHAEAIRDFVRRAESIDFLGLPELDAVTLMLLHPGWEIELEEHDSGIDVASWNLDSRGGPQVDFLTLAQDQPFSSAAERSQLLERWERMPLSIERSAANLRRGLAAGRVASRTAVEQVLEQLDAILATPPEKSPLVAPAAGGGKWVEPIEGDPDLALLASRTGASALDLRAVNEHMPARVRGSGSLLLVPSDEDRMLPPERARFLRAVYTVVRDRTYPAFRRYRDLLADEVLPRARSDEQPGVGALPGGDAYYQLCINREVGVFDLFGPVELEPARIHELGLPEVAKIRAEIEELGTRVLGVGDLPGIQKKLRESPEMHFANANEIQRKAEEALARAMAAEPQAFGIRPRAHCEVVPIPEHEAPFTTIAYYRQPAPDGSRPGRYYVNTYAPTTRTRYEAEALAFHEAVPGHHLQIAIAQELDGLPLVRRHSGSTAFVEGWALYTERLSDELGLYSSDLDRLGMLSFDAWRACRLVVDTGLHALGWSRQQAIDYMTANTLLAENNVANEVDRYIGNPGQALAYKIGQLEILDLRARAKAEFGERFDLKEFHDRVLENGAVTLSVLDEQIRRWIAREARP